MHEQSYDFEAGQVAPARRKVRTEEEPHQNSTLVSRNITILGRRTSVRLEPEMWNALKDIARRETCSTHDICSLIHLRKNPRTSLTAAIRVFLMLYYRAAATEQGHLQADHGNFERMKKRAKVSNEFFMPEIGIRRIAANGGGRE